MHKLFIALTFICTHLHMLAQDTAIKTTFSVPVGIYFSSESFFSKKPDIEAFEVVRTIVDHSKHITGYGYTVKVNDSFIHKASFCFFDGKDMYMQLNHGLVTRSTTPYYTDVMWVNEFFKMSKLGRYAYIVTYTGGLFKKAQEGVVADDSAVYKKKNTSWQIHYLNKKKELMKATPTGVGFLLKSEKDLYEEYQNEKVINNEVMRRYLDKMNERYPNW